jgi:site-specific recombinase XerC
MTDWTLTPWQVRALCEASARTREAARDRAILCLCLDAGLRRREIPHLRVRDVDLQRGVVSIGAGLDRRRVRLGATALDALAPFVHERHASERLLVTRSGTPVTDRTVHEQLRRLGELAGMGEWVTNRHTRHTFVGAIAAAHPAPVVLRLAGHAGHRIRPVPAEAALRAQFEPAWVSPLDAMLGGRGQRRVA